MLLDNREVGVIVVRNSFEKWLLGQGNLGSWSLDHKLGNGAFGIVFQASKVNINGQKTLAAIKVMTPDTHENAEDAQLFRHEFDVLSKMTSQYVPSVLDSGVALFQLQGETVPLLWFAMELITGGNLEDELKAHGALPESDWFELAHDLFSAVQDAHSHGIIHKDIKPANIARFARRSILLDFGVSSFVDIDDAGDVHRATIDYAAPEQLDGTPPETLQYPVDLFTSGVTLVHAATGKMPWPQPSSAEIDALMNAHPEHGDSQEARTAARAHLLMQKKLSVKANLEGLTKQQISIVEPLLNPNPALRGTAAEALKKTKAALPPGSSRREADSSGGSKQARAQASAAAATTQTKEPKQPRGAGKNYLTAWLLATLLGLFGVDRFYLGKIWSGVFKLLTLGGYGIWSLIDVILLTQGRVTDKWGRLIEDPDSHREKLKKFTWAACVISVLMPWVLIALT